MTKELQPKDLNQMYTYIMSCQRLLEEVAKRKGAKKPKEFKKYVKHVRLTLLGIEDSICRISDSYQRG